MTVTLSWWLNLNFAYSKWTRYKIPKLYFVVKAAAASSDCHLGSKWEGRGKLDCHSSARARAGVLDCVGGFKVIQNDSSPSDEGVFH